MNRNYILLPGILVLVAAVLQTCHADQDWSQFLGPDGSSEAKNCAPPTKWDKENYQWQTDLPGTGWSSPVHAGEKIWLTSAEVEPASKEQIAKKRKGVQFAKTKTVAGSLILRAICVDLDSGSIVHNLELAKVAEPDLINPLNSYASPTAAIDQGRVVCHFGAYGTWCLDASSGQEHWKTEYKIDHSVGPGSSPVIVDDKVILVCDGIDQQFVAAVGLSDGQEIWKTKRPPMKNNNGEFQKAYSTPLMIEISGKPQMVIPGAQWIVAYEPDSGKEIWKVDHGQGFSIAPLASFENGWVIFSTGFMRPEVVAIDPTGSGDITKTHVKWRAKHGPNMPSMLTVRGMVFYVSDKGILHCVDAKTGTVLNRKRLGGNYSSSPLLAGNHIYIGSREGKVHVVKADENLEVVATNSLEGQIMASPAPVKNDLIFRAGSKLYRIGKKDG